MLRSGIFIVGAKRTAFGAYGGSLKDKTATDLAEIAGRGALRNASINPEEVNHVIIGNTIQTSRCAYYLARHVGLRIKVPVHTPAFVVNSLCGSSFQAIISASQQIVSGDSGIVLAGGTEAMSQGPYITRGMRFGLPLFAKTEFEDSLWITCNDTYAKMPMGITAENLGAKYKISREESDNYAHKSHTRWRLASNAGYFKAEIEPIQLQSKKGENIFEVDEHPRETTIEELSKLKSAFQKDGLVTAGNASGICDGAAAVVVASEEAVKKLHLNPLARIVGWNSVGCEPTLMGIGPVEAIRGLCQKTGVPLEKVDALEINEAFACQTLAVQKELKLENDRINVNGGAIAMGHPLAASGARIMGHLAHEIQRRGMQYAIGSACIGGGQGIAIMLEKV